MFINFTKRFKNFHGLNFFSCMGYFLVNITFFRVLNLKMKLFLSILQGYHQLQEK